MFEAYGYQITTSKSDFLQTEEDVLGAKLRSPIEECNCTILRRRPLCRGAKTTGKLAELRQKCVVILSRTGAFMLYFPMIFELINAYFKDPMNNFFFYFNLQINNIE